MVLLDEISHRLETDFEFINFVRLQRLRIGMAVVRHHVAAARWIKRTMRGTQPSACNKLSKRIQSLGAVVARLGKLVGELNEKIGVARRRRSIKNKLDRSGNLKITF